MIRKRLFSIGQVLLFTVFVPYGHLPGTLTKKVKDPKLWIPNAVVNVFVENKSGHRIPDG